MKRYTHGFVIRGYTKKDNLCTLVVLLGAESLICFIGRESLEISNRQRIYMLLGSEFSSLEDPENTIARVMGWKSSDPLKELNDELAHEEGKTATIIIDALNEGAGTHFWMEQLPILKNKISRYNHLKMMVSLRNTFGNRPTQRYT